MEENRELAGWLIANRSRIESAMNARLGPAAPVPAAAESEALRRFRSFASAALTRGKVSPPPLDGLRINERRVMALIDAWLAAALVLTPPDERPILNGALTPLLDHFRMTIRSTQSTRRTRGTPRAKRRAVSAAIDRIAEAFLAIDADAGTIVDANPAAGALLGVHRDALIGVDAMGFVPAAERDAWWGRLDALTEGNENERWSASLLDHRGDCLKVEASATRYATRGRTLALVLMHHQAPSELRPQPGPPQVATPPAV